MALDVGAVKGALELTNNWSSTLQKAATDQQAFETQAKSGLAGVGVAAEKSGSSFDVLGTATSALQNPMGAAKDAIAGAAESMGGVAVASLAAVTGIVTIGTAMFELASRAAAVGAGLDDMADKTGLSVPALSRLSNAAQVIGADMGSLTDVVFKLQRGIGENSDTFQAGLKKMGLSTDELKAAGPDRYLELITAGLQGIADPAARAAAGNEVLGRGYKDVAAALQDLDAGFKATSDLSPWTAEQAKAAEAFEQQVASIETHVRAAGIAIGNELIPAASLLVDVLARTGLAVVHIVDLGGLVSGAWQGIKLALGEASLAEETAGAVAGTTNRLFAEQGATAQTVAAKMLALGFSVETVATQSGLGADAVKRLNVEMTSAKTAAADYAVLWDRVNALLAIGAPSLDGVSASTRGLVADMKAAGVTMVDMAAATGLTVGQLQLLDKEEETRAAADKKRKADELADLKALDEFRHVAHTRQVEILRIESDAALAHAGIVNAAIKAEFDAQTLLNKAWGLDASGSLTLQTTALDTLTKGMAALHLAKVEGISQAAQEKVLMAAYTADLYGQGVAQDKVQAGAVALGGAVASSSAIQSAAIAGVTRAYYAQVDAAMAAIAALSGGLQSSSGTRGGTPNDGSGERGPGVNQGLTLPVNGGVNTNPMPLFKLPGFSFKEGGPTGAGGPATLHPDEYVVPKDGALVMRGGSSGVTFLPGAIVIQVHGSVLAERELTDRLSDTIMTKVLQGQR